jgi:uncharacterized membrane protein YeaQ/YmgE (transglycosylase-associated protein family)
MLGFIHVLLVGAIVGLAARAVYPGHNTLHGLTLATVTGTIGVGLATFIGRWLHWVEADQLADVVGMFAATITVLFVWNELVLLAWNRLVMGLGKLDDKRPG